MFIPMSFISQSFIPIITKKQTTFKLIIGGMIFLISLEKTLFIARVFLFYIYLPFKVLVVVPSLLS